MKFFRISKLVNTGKNLRLYGRLPFLWSEASIISEISASIAVGFRFIVAMNKMLG